MSHVPVHLLLASAILVMAGEAGACPSGCLSYGYLHYDVDCSKRGLVTSGCAAYSYLSYERDPYRVADSAPVAPHWVAYTVCGQGLYPWDSVDCRTLYWRTKNNGSASKLISSGRSRRLRTALPPVRSETKINSTSSQVAKPIAPHWAAYRVCGQGLYPWDSVDCRTLYWRTKNNGSASKLISSGHSRRLRTALPPVRSTTNINSTSSQVAKPVAPHWVAYYSVCGQGLYPWDSVDCRTLYWRTKNNGSASELVSSGHGRRLRTALPPVRSETKSNSTSSQVAKPVAPHWVAYSVCGQGLYPWDSVDCRTLYWRTKNDGSPRELISSGHGRQLRTALPPARSATKINSTSSQLAKPVEPRENACSQYPNLC
jgi:hypothetical protein